VGLVLTPAGSRPCECQAREEVRIRLNRARIPAKFAACSLDNFIPRDHTRHALLMAQHYAETFIPGAGDPGLLFTGSVGTGKTHLAAAILRNLIETKGIEARWVTVPELLDQLRASYEPDAQQSQAQILAPILRADLVAIDELGSVRPGDWVFETVELLIGSLYNSARSVLVTTNHKNLEPGGILDGGTITEYRRAARAETLGDRIGRRPWSRLQQMCLTVEMSGPDWRAK
jgi:DNA replication protein DnaC